MEQHPIPQNISSYEFRLVGDMTLKQFFQLAGGIIIGLIIFRLPLPVIIKYPLVGLSVLAGILMAFVPINGRPFTTWLVAFIRAVYSPTQFTWRPDAPPALTQTANPASAPPPSPAVVPPPAPSPIFDAARIAKTPPLTPPAQEEATTTSTNQTGYLKVTPEAPLITPLPLSPPTPPPPPVAARASVEENQLPGPAPAPATEATPTPAAPLLPNFSRDAQVNAPAANTTTQITPPSLPNILTGLVTDSQGATVEGSIVEIIDNKTGIPARALRTNRLGQFQIATPLTPGAYTVQVEKDGMHFGPTSITVANTIIPPVIIRAKSPLEQATPPTV